MERQTRLFVFAFFFAVGALLTISAAAAAATAADLSAAGAAAHHQAAMPSSSSSSLQHALLRRVEDDASSFVGESLEEAAYPRRRVLYDSGSISYKTLGESKAACYGPCPARGQAYTGRGCLAIYQCRG